MFGAVHPSRLSAKSQTIRKASYGLYAQTRAPSAPSSSPSSAQLIETLRTLQAAIVWPSIVSTTRRPTQPNATQAQPLSEGERRRRANYVNRQSAHGDS